MLNTLKLHNFKTFLNAKFDFSIQHLVLGKNCSGKTNLASALRFLGATASDDLDLLAESSVPGGISEITNWNLKSSEFELSCECDLEFDGKPCGFQYELTLCVDSDSQGKLAGLQRLRVLSEILRVNAEGFDNFVLLESDGHEVKMVHEEQAIHSEAPHRPTTLAPKNATMLSKLYELESNRRAILFRRYLQNWAYFSLSPLSMRYATTTTTDFLGGLDSHGERLTNAIFHLKNLDERSYRRLIDHAQIIEPRLQAINFIPAPNQPPIAMVDLLDQPRASWRGLSDGTLRVLALALIIERSAACSPPNSNCPSLAIIEEPENGIFPGQLRRIFDLFEEWAPASQFIFTSHSPYFIDMFDANRDSVTILKMAKDRSECYKPGPPEPLDEKDRLTLSMEYASELFE